MDVRPGDFSTITASRSTGPSQHSNIFKADFPFGSVVKNLPARILYDPPPRVMKIKAKINKFDLMKLKSFCTTKETISKVKRQPSEWEKVIANEANDKGLISKL